MVIKLTESDKLLISSAITDAERITSAEIAVVITPASDGYASHNFLIGLVLGGVICSCLWFLGIAVSFPFLFSVQLLVICMVVFVPFLRNFCIYLIPKNIQLHRAAHRAYSEYMTVSRNVPAFVPVVLLYISLAEHYAHIIADRAVMEKTQDEAWDNVIKEFIAGMKTSSICDSCINAINKIAAQLTGHFPASQNPNYIGDHIIETK
jgi:putative membrane protein